MTTAQHPSLAYEVGAEVADSAKWYAAAAVVGAIAGGLFGLYDYTPPAPQTAPIVTPTSVQPPPAIRPHQSDGGDADLVAAAPAPRAVAVRHDPMHCVDQVGPDGKLLGQLCRRDPGGVAGSAVGSIQR